MELFVAIGASGNDGNDSGSGHVRVYNIQSSLENIKSGDITPVNGEGVTLPNNYKLIGGYIIGPHVDLTDATLTDADLTDAVLTGAVLTGVKSGNITPVNGEGVTLPNNYELIGGYIIGPHVDLTNATLIDADLTGVI